MNSFSSGLSTEQPAAIGKWIAVVGWAMFVCLTVTGCKKGESPSAKPVAAPYVVEVTKVKPQAFRETLFATGTLRARESVTLQTERAGVVKEIRFQEGKPVKAGEVLVVIDDSDLQAQLVSAKAQLELAAATEKRDRELLRTDRLVSEAAYEQSLANFHVAEAAVQLIEAQIHKTRIEAPFDGIAGLRRVSVGAYVTPGTIIGTFQDIGALKLDFTLPERYLANVRNARTVNIKVAGVSDSLTGTIYALEPAIDVGTRSLLARAIMPNEEQQLLPGGFAEVEVVLGDIPDAILIPPIALIPGLKAQKVLVHRNGQVEERAVETGLRTAESVQVVRGLQAGDELITSGILQLRPGMKIQVRPARDRAPEQQMPERSSEPRGKNPAGTS
jgi:membrane fusion protein (multidrug efflux system)